jgi:hypothetical protein
MRSLIRGLTPGRGMDGMEGFNSAVQRLKGSWAVLLLLLLLGRMRVCSCGRGDVIWRIRMVHRDWMFVCVVAAC